MDVNPPPSPASVNVKFIYQCADLFCLSRSVYCWILARVGIDNRTGTSPHTNKQKTYPSIHLVTSCNMGWVDWFRSSVSLCYTIRGLWYYRFYFRITLLLQMYFKTKYVVFKPMFKLLLLIGLHINLIDQETFETQFQNAKPDPLTLGFSFIKECNWLEVGWGQLYGFIPEKTTVLNPYCFYFLFQI